MTVLIKNVRLKDEQKDILIEGNIIKKIASRIDRNADIEIDGEGKGAIPSFINGHTHASMTLMRGYADDMVLHEWLEKKIWPFEEKLMEEDVYWGTRLACLEMIKSGTTFFNDMYWHYHGSARAVEDSGIRSAVSAVFIDMFDSKKSEEQIQLNIQLFEETKQYSNRVMFALGPHALYTVSEKSLRWAKQFSDEHSLLIHIHLSETEREVSDCIKRHGKRPVEYLESIGFLGPNIIAAHVIWVNDREIELLKYHDVKVVYCPTSNMKLSAGVFSYQKLKEAGLTIALGTDGCAANNNLDMLEEMKTAALLQKLNDKDPTVLSAQEVFDIATLEGARVFGLNCGEIKEGNLADLLLVDLKHLHLIPNHHIIPNLVYAAHGSCVNTTICDGKIIMQNGKVEGEEEVLEKAQEVVMKLTSL